MTPIRALLPLVLPALVLGVSSTLGGKAALADAFSDARDQALAGNYAQAIEAGKRIVQDRPNDIAAARWLHDLLRGLHRDKEAEDFVAGLPGGPTARYLAARALPPRKAVKEIKRWKSEDGAPTFARLDFAWALLHTGKASSADTEVKSYLKDHPDDAEGHYLRGRIAVARGSPKRALEPLAKALELFPGYPEAAVLLSEVHHALEEPALARQTLMTALARHSSNPRLRVGLGDDQARTGELAAALATLSALANEQARLADAHSHLAHVLRLKGDLAAAEASAKKALAIHAEDVVGLETLGFVLYKKRDLDGAMENYGQVIKIDPLRVEPYVIIGVCHALNKNLKHAEEMLDEALSLDKDHLDANLKMGVVQFGQGRHRSAKKHLGVVVKEVPDHAEAHRYLGYIALSDGKAKEALKSFQVSLQHDPDDGKTVRMVGRCYFDLGRKEEAIEMFQRAIDLDEKDAWAHFDLGKARDDAGEYEVAKGCYLKAIELDPKFCWPHLYVAEIYDDVEGDEELALRHYKLFLELKGPDPGKSIEKRIEQLSDD